MTVEDKNNKKQCNLCTEHSGIKSRMEQVEKDTNKQWDVLDKLRNRPPVWVTIVISALTFLLGLSLKYGYVVGAVAKGTEY